MAEAGVREETIAQALNRTARALATTSATPRLDAELLLGHLLGLGRAALVTERDASIDVDVRDRLAQLLSRRLTGEPVAYLLGRRGFRHLELTVDGRVLIPRPETELLVEWARDTLPTGANVLDVGTGSGAIALALADERPDLTVRGVDVSPSAVALARENAAALGLDVSFAVGDLVEGAGPADAILANLPYVAPDAELPRDVADFEPAVALYGGADGLEVLARLAGMLAARGWPSWIGLEIGSEQGAAVSGLIAGAGFGAIEVRQDLAGLDRIVVGQR